MGGGLMQLVAYGAQDIYLTGNPQITFFKCVYRRHTNFALESIENVFSGNADFGKKVTCTISRNGDLIWRTYLRVVLPDVTVQPGCAFRWLNYVGQVMINNFMTPGLEHACWRPSLTQAADFAKRLSDPPSSHFRGRAEMRLYFPVYSRYYVYKSYSAGAAGGFTLLRVLKLFESLAEVAIAHYLKHTEGQKDIRRRDVHKLLRNYAICSLRVKDNRVYAMTHDAREKLP